ncbi:MAG: hypothetical protein KAH44_14870, partial [Oricola sp.]|nr:hypothetical protein [Oricola sp.]
MATLDEDRRGEILHQLVLPAAHVTPIGLKEKPLCISPSREPGTVIKYASISAIRGVPDRIIGLCLRIFSVMCRQIAVAIHSRTKHYTRIDFQERLLDLRHHRIREPGEIR